MRPIPIFIGCMTLFTALASAGCSNDSGSARQITTGTLELPLQATSSSGKIYRLRNASFEVSGPTDVTLSTPPPPDDSQPALTQILLSGAYSIRLRDGWHLWRIASDGSEGIVPATLVSANPTAFQIASGVQGSVVFAFNAVDDGVVTFGSGTLNVEISVSETDGGASCVPTAGPDLPDDTFADSNCDGIDGDVSAAVFVASDGLDGNTGSPASPLLTVQAGIDRAVLSGKSQVYVSEGTYVGAVTLANGISVYGGYSRNSNWQRNAGFVSALQSNVVAAFRIVTLQGTDITLPTTLDRLTVRAGDPMAPPGVVGATTQAVFCARCTAVTLKNSTLVAGQASNGAAGGNGSVGGNGGNGVQGTAGSQDGAMVGPGGGGGTSTCGRPGGPGGGGGTNTSPGNGQDGQFGTVVMAGGGTPGTGGLGANPGALGGTGQGGQVGGNGSPGGAGTGMFMAGLWTTMDGVPGAIGTAGHGGGGGGGGGGQICGGVTGCTNGAGNGGGGGGAGGCPGTGSAGGKGGGASVGLTLVQSTGFQLVATTIQSSRAGNGGDGGVAGNGGNGGNGAPGASAGSGQIGAGGPGGAGGRGGNGGRGGGGAGGSSFAVVLTGTMLSTAGNTLAPGQPGSGGVSTFSGSAGMSGTLLSL